MMKRHYYLGEDLQELTSVERELESAGLEEHQINVLSDNGAEIDRQQLHAVNSFSRLDVVQSGLVGLGLGLLCGLLVLTVTYYSGIYQTITWVPPVFFAVVVLGFGAWEGGLWGIHKINRMFARFRDNLARGQHVFIVDVHPDQESLLRKTIEQHPQLVLAGHSSASEWAHNSQSRWQKFLHWAP